MAVLNPDIAYAIVRRNSVAVGIHLAAPQQDGFLAISSVRERVAELEAFLTRQGTAPAELLQQMPSRQIMVAQDAVATYPTYRADPDFQGNALPSEFIDELVRSSTEMTLCSGAVPDQLRARLPRPYGDLRVCSPDEQVLWSKDRATSVWWPYPLSQEGAAAFAVRHAEQAATASGNGLSPPPTTAPVLLEALVPRFQRRAMAEYFRSLRLSGCMRLGDRDSKQRAWMHNEKFARFLGLQFGELISARLGIQVAPLFSHFVSYLEGASLPKHVDKDPNAFSLSIQLGFYRGGCLSDNEWAFNVQTPGDGHFTAFTPACGDGVLFHGASQEHYRSALPPDCVSDILLLHFTRLV